MGATCSLWLIPVNMDLRHESGSTFSSVFPQPVVSNVFTIDVQATRLKFSSVPQHVGLGEGVFGTGFGCGREWQS